MRLAPLLLIGTPILCAALGYGLGLALKPAPHPAVVANAGPSALDLGIVAVRIYRTRSLATLTAQVTAEVSPDQLATLDTPAERARLRQRSLALLLDAVETPAFRTAAVTAPQITALLQPVLTKEFPGVLSVTVPSVGQIDSPRS
ncbi:hypothetical protein FGG78_22770 [Thioclava sp. BHET1]|nr:hypothetical protein FGG78_22770 [Thioclava sp. BHET1]